MTLKEIKFDKIFQQIALSACRPRLTHAASRAIRLARNHLIKTIIAAWLIYSAIYFLLRSELSYSSPQDLKTARPHIEKFFSNVCDLAYKGNNLPHFFEKVNLGCEYHYTDDVFKISFLSYGESTLRLKIIRKALVPTESTKTAASVGVILIDFSSFEKIEDKILVRIIPYMSFDQYLIQPHSSQANSEGPNAYLWGDVLGRQLIGLGKNGGVPSMTVGQDHPMWLNSFNNKSYLDIKKYFENGDMSNAGLNEFATYSFQILTASNTGQIMPNSLLMRMIISSQSLIAIILLGLWVSRIYEIAAASDSKNRS